MIASKVFSEERVQDFNEVYNNYYSVIFSSIFSKINDFHEAEDICQEIFLRFYDKFETIESPRKWLFGAMRIVMLDYYKAKKKKNSREVLEEIETLFEDVSMSYVNGFRDTRLIIEEALNDNSIYDNEKERLIFEIIAFHNFTFAQASRHFNMHYWQVKYAYEKVVKAIMTFLNSKGIKSLEDLL